MLNGEKISAANEIEMAQDEYAALKSENELLKVFCLDPFVAPYIYMERLIWGSVHQSLPPAQFSSVSLVVRTTTTSSALTSQSWSGLWTTSVRS